MTTTCPECGSNEIVPDLLVFSSQASEQPPHVKLVEPEPPQRPFIWMPKTVASGFRASICGACGYTRFYTKYHAEILAAHRKGFKSPEYLLQNVLPM